MGSGSMIVGVGTGGTGTLGGLARPVFERLPLPAAEVDGRGRVVRANPAFAALVGEAPDGRPATLGDWVPAEDLTLLEEALVLTLRHRRAPEPLLVRFGQGDGRLRWVQLALVDLDAGRDGRVLLLGTDLTELKERELALEYRAMHDPLTGLANRALAVDRLEQALHRVQRSATGAAVLFVDLDGFKHINDAHGHEVGDTTLVAVADALRRNTRARDTVARYGGDEFVVCLDDLPVESVGAFRRVEALAHRLLADIAAAGTAVDPGHPVTASIGATLVLGVDPAARPADLLAEADAAAYAAKRAGGDRWAAVRHPRALDPTTS